MNKRIVFILSFVISLALLFSLSRPKSQAVMAEMSLEQLTEDADLIVVGKVGSVTSQIINEKIFSFATISVSSKIKGELKPEQSKVMVKFPGGKVGDIGMKVEDSPNYKKDEEVVVFLKSVPSESDYMTVGSSQGKLIVDEGIVLRENMPLELFISRVKSIIKSGP